MKSHRVLTGVALSLLAAAFVVAYFKERDRVSDTGTKQNNVEAATSSRERSMNTIAGANEASGELDP